MNSRLVALAATMLLLVSAGAPMLAFAAPTDDPDVNYGAADAPDVRVHEDVVTIAEHDNAAMDGPLAYYDDNGSVADLGDYATINSSEDLPVGVRITQMNDTFLSEFPRVDGEDSNSVSAIKDSGDWSTSTSGGSVSFIDNTGNTATGVPSVQFQATSMGAGDNATATYSNFTVSSDATKRVGMVAMNVENVDAKTNVSIQFEESDGDYVDLTFNQSADPTANESIIANSSGTNYVAQEKFANLNVEGSGDGTLSAIDKVQIYVEDGNADVTLVGLDVEKKTTVDLGETERDTDGDGTQETTTIEDYHEGGVLRLTGLDTLPSALDNAVIRNKKVYNLHYEVSKVSDSNTNVTLSDAQDFPGYDKRLDAYYRLEVPAAIDLSHGTLDLEATQVSPENWYQTFEYATDTGDTDLHNVSYTDAISSFTDEGSDVELATGVSAGVNLAVHVDKTLTSEAAAGITAASPMAGGPVGSSSGGIVGFLTSPLGSLISAVTALFGGIKLLGSRGN